MNWLGKSERHLLLQFVEKNRPLDINEIDPLLVHCIDGLLLKNMLGKLCISPNQTIVFPTASVRPSLDKGSFMHSSSLFFILVHRLLPASPNSDKIFERCNYGTPRIPSSNQ